LTGDGDCPIQSIDASYLGERSLPSCLGGGDLDGDLFTVIGLPELVPKRTRIHPPASYLPPEMRKLDRDCRSILTQSHYISSPPLLLSYFTFLFDFKNKLISDFQLVLQTALRMEQNFSWITSPVIWLV
jgi:hypothetical protein